MGSVGGVVRVVRVVRERFIPCFSNAKKLTMVVHSNSIESVVRVGKKMYILTITMQDYQINFSIQLLRNSF